MAPQDREGFELGWLFQLVAVFVFFVLPVIRSIAESRKRGAAGKGPAPRPKAAPDGREAWRELLEGRRPQPARPAAAPPRPRARPAPPVAPPAQPAPLGIEVPPPAPAPRVSVAPAVTSLGSAARLPKSVSSLASAELDPASLDDEMAERWGASRGASVAPVARTPAADRLLRDLDWRRAVLLSEVLAPPLALRGPASAWPGPPASLVS